MTRKKVLLVDDSNTVLMMEKMILAKGPYDVVTARDGDAAPILHSALMSILYRASL
jgi:PleD family two-component response regulator